MKNNIKDTSDKARANILNRLKHADINKGGLIPERGRSADVFPVPENLLDTFIEEFEKVNGQVFVCNNDEEFTNHFESERVSKGWTNIICKDDELKVLLPEESLLTDDSKMDDIGVGITACEYLIARTGSIMISAAGLSGRLLNVFPPVHVVVAHENQLVAFLDDAIEKFSAKYSDNWPSQATIVTGPSRTADIEKTLVMGAHGPKELILFVRKY
ncbi:LutC/YkgG family protein [Carboxylicivirga marina]|uniref:LUD domain-containing protein n=1 Tax=Carboxylicivirga marina TaxID=2800988 RepID=A0ABS1HIY2_9BACT|nr:LUD domain-containing protein [Carboxylicivirga marina]MBK3517258.1 LUD domain-containing protein [Carboxylicivirga marina]